MDKAFWRRVLLRWARSRSAALEIRRRARPHHRLAQPFRSHVPYHLERSRTHGRQLHTELGLAFGVVNPATVPGAIARRLDLADDLDAAHLLGVCRILQPHKAAAQLIAALGDLHRAAARMIKPKAGRLDRERRGGPER